MKLFFARLMRRIIRSQLKKTSHEKLFRASETKFVRAYQRAARKSYVYRTLLSESAIDINSIKCAQDVIKFCPILKKENTFRRFSLPQLIAEDIHLTTLASVLTSSGHGSSGFALGLSTRNHLVSTPSLIDLGLDMAFEVDRYRTLLINCLPMGVTFQSNAVCVANVSVREDMACAIVEQAGPLFEQIVLCGDPLFLKKLCDYSQRQRLDWSKFRMNVVIGEETFSESFRDYLAKILQIDLENHAAGTIISSMGVGELGLNLFTETRETIALRRVCMSCPELTAELFQTNEIPCDVPTFLVFSPLRSFVEIDAAGADGVGDLLITMLDPTSLIPLIRYQTGDRAKLISSEQLEHALKENGIELDRPLLPMIALFGRKKDRLPEGGHVDQYKHVLYKNQILAQNFSGAFRLSTEANGILWEVQLTQGANVEPAQISRQLASSLSEEMGNVQIECYHFDTFPYGQMLDYERKFNYWTPA